MELKLNNLHRRKKLFKYLTHSEVSAVQLFGANCKIPNISFNQFVTFTVGIDYSFRGPGYGFHMRIPHQNEGMIFLSATTYRIRYNHKILNITLPEEYFIK